MNKKLKVKAPKPNSVDGHIADYHASRGKSIPGAKKFVNRISRGKLGK